MTRRAILLLLTLGAATTAFASDVLVTLPFPTAARPGERAHMTAAVHNRVPDRPVSSVRLVVTFDPALAIEDEPTWQLPAGCTSTPGRIECTKSDLGFEDLMARFVVHIPESPAARAYVLTAEVTATPVDTTPFDNTATTTIQVIGQHVVSNTNDSGPGSLRAAIEAANDWCTQERPCEIRFDVPRDSVAVIEPLSPLPPLTACGVKVGGPPPFGGARPPVRVEVNGRRLASGYGLELRSACTHPLLELTGMRITDFPGDGVAVTAANVYILHGFEVLRNGGRGIVVLANVPRVEVNHALIAENRRSGIAMFDGNLNVQHSSIGIGWDGEERANGASGIFIAPTGRNLRIRRSTIANHPHYGVALATRGDVDIDAQTVITRNILDVDWFLDGPSPNQQRPDIPRTPRVLSAVYDPPANATRITVSLQEHPVTITEARFYVSDRITIFGTAHLERYIGASFPGAETFTIVLPATGDIRGKYLSAVTARLFHNGFFDGPPAEMRWVSEVSAAVKVE